MKKLWIVIPVGLIALLSFLPSYFGSMSREHYERSLEYYFDNSLFSVENVSETSSMFKSHLKTKISVDNAEPDDDFDEITLNQTIYHGPYIMSSDSQEKFLAAYVETKIDVNSEGYQEIKQIFGKQEPLLLTTKVRYDGTSETKVFSPSVKHFGDNVKVIWGGVTGTIHNDKDMSSSKTNLLIPSLAVEEDKVLVIIKNIGIKSDVVKGPHDLLFGNFTVNIEKTKIKEDGRTIVTIDDQTISTDIEDLSPVLNIKYYWGFQKMSDVAKSVGPLKFPLVLKNIDTQAYSELMTLINTYGNDESELAAAMMNAQDELSQLLKRQPSLEIQSAELIVPDGTFKLKATVSAGGKNASDPFDTKVLFSSIRANIFAITPKTQVLSIISKYEKDNIEMMLLQKSRAAIKNPNLETPKIPSPNELDKMAEKAAQRKISAWIREGYLTDLENNYQFQLSFEEGNLKVNGREIPIF